MTYMSMYMVPILQLVSLNTIMGRAFKSIKPIKMEIIKTKEEEIGYSMEYTTTIRTRT